MKDKEILENLCLYDRRNPDSILHIDEDNIDVEKNDNCACDNCFYGRTKLAEELLKFKKLDSVLKSSEFLLY